MGVSTVMSNVEIAAIIFSFAAAIIIVFHLLLAFGFPLGGRAMGGKYPDQWPDFMRIIAILIVCFWILVSILVMVQAGLLFREYQDYSRVLGWFIVLFCGVQVVLHVISPSKKERQIWLPVTIILLVSSMVVLT